MAAHQKLTPSQSTPWALSIGNQYSQRGSQPPAENVWLSTVPQTTSITPRYSEPDLFTSLLLNREHVYGTGGVAVSQPAISTVTKVGSPIPHPKWDCEDHTKDYSPLANALGEIKREAAHGGHQRMLGHLHKFDTMAAASKGRQRPAKRNTTRRKDKRAEDGDKKRSRPQLIPVRATKIQKTEANSKKKIETRGTVENAGISALIQDSTPEIIVISDDEDEDEGEDTNKIVRAQWRKSLENLETKQPTQRLHGSDDGDRNSIKVDTAESDSDIEPVPSQRILQHELIRLKFEHVVELQELRQQLDTAKAENERVRIHLEAKLRDKVLSRAISDEAAAGRFRDLERELEAEQSKVLDLTQQRDQLRADVDTSKTRHDELAAKYQTLQCSQQTEVFRATAACSQASSVLPCTLSPAPSSHSSLSNEDQKAENLRRTYLKVKRRFDNLHSVCVNLATCTRSMDLSSFGEFGRYLDQLKAALEEDGQEKWPKEVENRRPG